MAENFILHGQYVDIDDNVTWFHLADGICFPSQWESLQTWFQKNVEEDEHTGITWLFIRRLYQS